MTFIIISVIAIAFILWIAYEVKNAKTVNDEEFESFHKEAVDFRSID